MIHDTFACYFLHSHGAMSGADARQVVWWGQAAANPIHHDNVGVSVNVSQHDGLNSATMMPWARACLH